MTSVKVFVLAGSALAAVALLVGLLLPYASETVDGSIQTASVLTYGFLVFSTPGGGADVLGIAFVALSITVVTTLAALVFIVRGHVRRTAPITLAVTLLLLGTAGAWIVMVVGLTSNDPDWTFEAGLPVLTIGVLLAAVIALVPAVRRAWTA